MVGIKSDLGNKRILNEDYAEYYEGKDYSIFVLADGMGGHNAGEIASETASKAFISYINKNIDVNEKNKLIKDAFIYANLEVYNLAKNSEKLTGMGTTLVACLKTKEKVYIGNVGDSSCFGIIKDYVVKITKDHSLVQELLDSGNITVEQAINHPQKNVITRAVGTSKDIEIDIFEIDKNKYEYFLMCSDGLSNDVDINKELYFDIRREENLQKVCEKLVQCAKDNGGRDNITVMLFEGEV